MAADGGSGARSYSARYYHPSLGRFISEDPIGARGGINLYAYTNDNPTGLNDPSGKDPQNGGDGGNGSCVDPNGLQTLGIAAQNLVAQIFNETVGFGAGVSAGAGSVVGAGFSVSRQIIVTPRGDAAFQTSVTTFDSNALPLTLVSSGYGGYGGLQVSFSISY